MPIHVQIRLKILQNGVTILVVYYSEFLLGFFVNLREIRGRL